MNVSNLFKLCLVLAIIFFFTGCAGRSTWCGSGSQGKHCSAEYRHSYYTLCFKPQPLTDVEARNLLRAAVYAQDPHTLPAGW